MPLSRREFIAGLGAVTGIRLLSPVVVRAGEALGQTMPDPALSKRNRLLVINLMGGNDGLNTVVPRGDVSGAPRYSVYRKVRPSIAYAPSATLALDLPGDRGEKMGLNPRLKTMHRLYRDQRVAVVQGVDYPEHNYSHFVSTDIWESGEPDRTPDSGWLGRHLDRAHMSPGELRGLGIGYELPLILRGRQRSGVDIESVSETRFADGTTDAARARHTALRRYGSHTSREPLRLYAGQTAARTVALVDALARVKPPPVTSSRLANSLLTARTLLVQPFGVECVFVTHYGSYDTHTTQRLHHEAQLTELDQAIEAFLFGTMGGKALGIGPLPSSVATRTLIMTTSEFGRRIGENGAGATAGTDHGAAAPVFLVGPPHTSTASRARLVPGLHGEHPSMGTTTLPADNLTMTTDLRRVYQTLLQDWLRDPDPGYERRYRALSGIFTA